MPTGCFWPTPSSCPAGRVTGRYHDGRSGVTCPFCTSLAPLTAAGRMPCPRCGEEFAPPSDGITATPPEPTALAPPPTKPVEANRIVGGIVLGVMAVMAGVGLWL